MGVKDEAIERKWNQGGRLESIIQDTPRVQKTHTFIVCCYSYFFFVMCLKTFIFSTCLYNTMHINFYISTLVLYVTVSVLLIFVDVCHVHYTVVGWVEKCTRQVFCT